MMAITQNDAQLVWLALSAGLVDMAHARFDGHRE
jgi:hypothetical protein